MSLDPQKLEELLIERALGALSPEAELLLSDYLERNPAAHHLADRYQDVVHLAGKVLASAHPVTVPPFPAKALQDAERKGIGRIILKRSLSWAACLIIGFAIGLAVTGIKSPFESDHPQPLAASPGLETEPLPASKSSFWSFRLSARPGENRERKALRLIWKSPVEQPSIGG